MESIFVDSPLIEVDNIEMGEKDAAILEATHQYVHVMNKVSDLFAKTDDKLLSGSAGTVYLKRMGHRPLSAADVESLLNAYGSEEDKQAIINFEQAQLSLCNRLENTKAIGLVIEQTGMTKNIYYHRLKNPSLWKPDEITTIIEVLERLRI